MENLSAVEQLDKLLEYFANEKSRQVTFDDIKKKFEIDRGHIRVILDRLLKDEYVRSFEQRFSGMSKETYLTYSLTFDGRVFFESGGYKKEKATKEIEFQNSLNEKIISQRNERRLVWGTWFAGIAAILVLFWQILTYFFPSHIDLLKIFSKT